MSEFASLTSAGAVVFYVIRTANKMSFTTPPLIILGMVLIGTGAFIDVLWGLGYMPPLICSEDTHSILTYMGVIFLLAASRRRTGV